MVAVSEFSLTLVGRTIVLDAVETEVVEELICTEVDFAVVVIVGLTEVVIAGEEDELLIVGLTEVVIAREEDELLIVSLTEVVIAREEDELLIVGLTEVVIATEVLMKLAVMVASMVLIKGDIIVEVVKFVSILKIQRH